MKALLLAANRLFPLPVHPFNLQNEGKESYAMWQYRRGADTIAFYRQRYTLEEMFQGKRVLDIGCGAGGKTMYYAAQGVEHIYGMDIVAGYRQQAEELAQGAVITGTMTEMEAKAAAEKLGAVSMLRVL